jgi:hypothetical protein
MIKQLRRKLSRMLMQMRVSRYGNNHSWRLNRRYKAYHRHAQRHFRPTTPRTEANALKTQVDKFRRDGFLIVPSILDSANAHALKTKVDRLFEDPANVLPISKGLIRLIDGAEKVPEVVNLLQDSVAEIIESYFGSHFKLYNMSFYRTVPDESVPASSFLWHFDNSPDEEIKLMIYLDEVTEDTGAFRFKDEATSERARALGFWHRDDYDLARDVFEEPATTVVAEGGPGTTILFRQGRVVHKATAPVRDHRDAVTMVIIPSVLPWREHYARNRHLLSTNAGLCKNPWTDEPENIGYRY